MRLTGDLYKILGASIEILRGCASHFTVVGDGPFQKSVGRFRALFQIFTKYRELDFSATEISAEIVGLLLQD